MNILLVDDDRFIIEALREKIDWDKLHIDMFMLPIALLKLKILLESILLIS